LSFDPSTGRLAIRADADDHIVREAVSADGFVEVTVDGAQHSSNPRSTDFDRVLAGATSNNLSQVRFDGAGGENTLVLATQSLPHSLAVTAAGADVVTEDVTVARRLAIQAQDITVRGGLQGESTNLTASGWVNVEKGGRIEALPTQRRAGGVSPLLAINVTADVFVNAGQIHADGGSGGQIVVQARNILNAGPITADASSPSADGGTVHLGFTDSYVGTAAGLTSANGASGGSIVIDGGATGHLFSSGRHVATGSVGGSINLLGREVVLAGVTVDASGETGGGSVSIGENSQSRDPAVGNTQTVTITSASTIRADALHSGDGGRVSVWADRNIAFSGIVSVHGGPAGGSGGFIDVSGKGDLSFAASADAAAPSGKSGTLLLDPKNITIGDASAAVFPRFDLIDPHPSAVGRFGTTLLVLDNGNVVVTNPYDDFGGARAGAAYLFDGSSGILISSLFGSHANDAVASAVESLIPIVRLTEGNYLVVSPDWNSNRGAVTWGSGRTGISGVVSDGNSLVGSNPGNESGVKLGDRVGSYGIVLLSSGNYVVQSRNGGDGAVTWGDGNTGTSGIVSDANSLVGGGFVVLLTNGNYLVVDPDWNATRGAVTWADGNTGIRGVVSAANSLVGSSPGDSLGFSIVTGAYFSADSVFALSNGNYIVVSSAWNGHRGAVTWGDGGRGISGIVSEVNSLVGSMPGDGNPSSANPGDLVGHGIILLPNGNYVVRSPEWNEQRGAVTWGNGSAGVSGTVSAANSLVGSDPGDLSFVTPLSNGNYVVLSPNWSNQRGAVTWGNGSTGVSGRISAANSLVGSNPGDQVGYYARADLLSNGNYVIESPSWGAGHGAVTWADASTGVRGIVSETNSLVDTGPAVVTSLRNGNFVVQSWNGSRGAVTWANGSTGITGTVSAANSLVGSHDGDQVGFYGGRVTPLTNGNYVVESPSWNDHRGAATWGNGNTGIIGTVSSANSLVGSNTGDGVPYRITPLSNGNYVMTSSDWNSKRGAVTWGNGDMGISGILSAANSLVGANPGDVVGSYGAISLLTTGNYLVASRSWNGNRGAVTWGDGYSGVSGAISAANSLVGDSPGDYVGYSDSVGGRSIVVLNNGNCDPQSILER
jgi:hypothetical protein